MFAARTVEEVISFPAGSRVISWLPAAHIAERMAHHYIPIVYAGTITCAPNPREVLSYLPQVRPDLVLRRAADLGEAQGGAGGDAGGASPRSSGAPIQEALAGRRSSGCACASRASRCRPSSRRRWPRLTSSCSPSCAQMLGLDQVVAVNVGAAPTPVEVLEFFHALGIELAELWGMSETCGVGAVNRPGAGQDRHRRPAVSGGRAQARRRRRGAVPRRVPDDRLPQPARDRPPRRSTPTAGCTPATSARSTTTAT